MGSKQNEIVLTGLKGSHPLGALAAFGLLRCCAEMPDEIYNPRLHWQFKDDWLAVLTTDDSVTPDDLVSLLVKRMSKWEQRLEFTWADDIKRSSETFADKAKEAVSAAAPNNRGSADFFAAYGCELKERDGKLIPTAFHMLSGQQTFFKKVLCEIAASLVVNPKASESKQKEQDRKTRESFSEALFGPWLYKDDQHPMGWDSSMERVYALRAGDPKLDKNSKNRSVKTAVWLAAESLPLFPCCVSGSKLITRGFTEMRRKEKNRYGEVAFFSWPVWIYPLCLDAVRSTLSLKALTLEKPLLSELRTRGIAQVFRSRRVKLETKGDYKIFRAAYPCAEVKE